MGDVAQTTDGAGAPKSTVGEAGVAKLNLAHVIAEYKLNDVQER